MTPIDFMNGVIGTNRHDFSFYKLMYGSAIEDETFSTNCSLMEYAPSVNRTQIVEDRTMNTQDQIAKIHKEEKELNGKLKSEARMVGNVVLTASLHCPSTEIDWEKSHAEVELQCNRARRQEKAYAKGDILDGVTVNMQSLSAFDKAIQMTPELDKEIRDFRHHICTQYVNKIAKLRATKHNLRVKGKAERNLEYLSDSARPQPEEDMSFFF